MRHLDDEDLDAIGVLLAERILGRLNEMESLIMAAIDDLNTAVTNVQAAATNIEGALASVDQSPAIAAAAASVQAVADSLNTAVNPPAPPAN